MGINAFVHMLAYEKFTVGKYSLNIAKLSVSLGSLTPFGTSSTKFFFKIYFLQGRKCGTIRHL